MNGIGVDLLSRQRRVGSSVWLITLFARTRPRYVMELLPNCYTAHAKRWMP